MREERTQFTLRIPTSLLKEVKEKAEVNKRSAAKEIEYILATYLAANNEPRVAVQQ